MSDDESDEAGWYRDAIIYQLHIRAFRDSDADGIGDFAGLTEKLDYLRDLGVTAVWLLPFYPVPLKDDGYDIADYNDVNPSYGTLQDFKIFLREAHRRGLKVITELVINHTSDQHPWFQRARRARPGSRAREFYVWSSTPDRYADARIIFKDFERSNWTWDAEAGAYYWHRFYSHQPDLNFDNPTVQKATFAALDFWLKMGVDGLRLDAVPYLYEREGTSCENLPETHEFLRELRRRLDAKYEDRMLLAEANQWPEDAVAYFGTGDECHMAFHFPVMPRLFMAVQQEDRFPVIDILQQTPPIPETAQWAVFLRNHDELTLEMVTDEERDYMYRVYASDPQARINLGIRRRLAPLMGNDRRRIELMNALLFSLPGTPVVYYGDEIGMGDNIYLGDRNGVRTPMQWSPDRNAGFSQANPQKLYSPVIIDPEYHYEAFNVDAQQNNPHSLLWWMKHIIGLRRQYRAFGRGTLRFLFPDNPRVLAFIREYEEERILILANLSRYAQAVQLDLGDMQGVTPVEMFGRTPFPTVGPGPYTVTLNPYAFYWFLLPVSTAASRRETREFRMPAVAFSGNLEELVLGDERELLEGVLPSYLRESRWFRGKARQMSSVEVAQAIRGQRGRSRGAGGRRGGALPRRRRRALHHPARLRGGRPGPRHQHGLARLGPPFPRRRWHRVRCDGRRGIRQRDGGRHRPPAALARPEGRAGGEPHPRLSRAPGRGRDAAGRPAARRTVQHLRQPRRSAALQALPKGGAGPEPGSGAGPLPHRADRLPPRPDARRRPRAPQAEPGAHHRGRAASVRAQRGRRLDVHAQRAEPLSRSAPWCRRRRRARRS